MNLKWIGRFSRSFIGTGGGRLKLYGVVIIAIIAEGIWGDH